MIRANDNLRARCLHPMSNVQMHMPARVGDYTGKSVIIIIHHNEEYFMILLLL